MIASFSLGMSHGFSSTLYGEIRVAPGMISELTTTSKGSRRSNRGSRGLLANAWLSCSGVILCSASSASRRLRLFLTMNPLPAIETHAIAIVVANTISQYTGHLRDIENLQSCSRRRSQAQPPRHLHQFDECFCLHLFHHSSAV